MVILGIRQYVGTDRFVWGSLGNEQHHGSGTIIVFLPSNVSFLLYMVLVCLQNCLFSFKINLIDKFFKPWIYPYTPGMLYIRYGKMYSHKQRIFLRNLNPLKNLLSIS